MSKSIVKVEKVRELRDASDEKAEWAESLRATTHLQDVMALDLDDADDITYGLNKSDRRFGAWMEFLTLRREGGLHTYIEADAETHEVQEVLPSFPYYVREVNPRPVEGRLTVSLHTSPALFYLNPALPRFGELRAALEKAARESVQVLVTSHPLTFEIIDVRDAPAEETPEGGLRREPEKSVLDDTTTNLLASPITMQQATAAFDHLLGSDIPFNYVKDCCSARAQKMCRLLRENLNIRSRKLFNYGRGFPKYRTLFLNTPNDPERRVYWLYHVAPIVAVTGGAEDVVVIDPAMSFGRPVPVETWVNEQNDSGARQIDTHENIYEHNPLPDVGDLYAPCPAKVDKALQNHISNKRLRDLFSLVLQPLPS